MATKISGMTAITAGNLDDTALFETVDKNGATRKSTLAQIRTALLTAGVITNVMLAGSIANSKTTATSANTASAIVARDASGNFAAGSITPSNVVEFTSASAQAAAAGVRTAETNTGTGLLRFQAGAFSAAFGAGIVLYAHANATHPGDVYLGVSSGSGGSIRFGDTGQGTGSTVFSVVGANGNTIVGGTLTTVGAFGCNTKVAQTAYASGGAVATTGSALVSYGYTQSQADGIVTLLNNVRAALVANGIMS